MSNFWYRVSIRFLKLKHDNNQYTVNDFFRISYNGGTTKTTGSTGFKILNTSRSISFNQEVSLEFNFFTNDNGDYEQSLLEVKLEEQSKREDKLIAVAVGYLNLPQLLPLRGGNLKRKTYSIFLDVVDGKKKEIKEKNKIKLQLQIEMLNMASEEYFDTLKREKNELRKLRKKNEKLRELENYNYFGNEKEDENNDDDGYKNIVKDVKKVNVEEMEMENELLKEKNLVQQEKIEELIKEVQVCKFKLSINEKEMKENKEYFKRRKMEKENDNKLKLELEEMKSKFEHEKLVNCNLNKKLSEHKKVVEIEEEMIELFEEIKKKKKEKENVLEKIESNSNEENKKILNNAFLILEDEIKLLNKKKNSLLIKVKIRNSNKNVEDELLTENSYIKLKEGKMAVENRKLKEKIRNLNELEEKNKNLINENEILQNKWNSDKLEYEKYRLNILGNVKHKINVIRSQCNDEILKLKRENNFLEEKFKKKNENNIKNLRNSNGRMLKRMKEMSDLVKKKIKECQIAQNNFNIRIASRFVIDQTIILVNSVPKYKGNVSVNTKVIFVLLKKWGNLIGSNVISGLEYSFHNCSDELDFYYVNISISLFTMFCKDGEKKSLRNFDCVKDNLKWKKRGTPFLSREIKGFSKSLFEVLCRGYLMLIGNFLNSVNDDIRYLFTNFSSISKGNVVLNVLLKKISKVHDGFVRNKTHPRIIFHFLTNAVKYFDYMIFNLYYFHLRIIYVDDILQLKYRISRIGDVVKNVLKFNQHFVKEKFSIFKFSKQICDVCSLSNKNFLKNIKLKKRIAPDLSTNQIFVILSKTNGFSRNKVTKKPSIMEMKKFEIKLSKFVSPKYNKEVKRNLFDFAIDDSHLQLKKLKKIKIPDMFYFFNNFLKQSLS